MTGPSSSPTISVIIPLYNKALHVERAIRSVLQQSLEPAEIIVVDDGSTDGGPELVERLFGEQVSLVRQPNGGESAARNRGISEARHPLLAFVDSDDEWKPRFLAHICELAERYPRCGAYATSYDIVEAKGKRRHVYVPSIRQSWQGVLPNYFDPAHVSRPPFCASSIAVPAEVFAELGSFPLGLRRGADLHMWTRIALRHPIAYDTSPLAVYHQDADNRACVNYVSEGEPATVMAFRQAVNEGWADENVGGPIREYLVGTQVRSACWMILAGERARAKKLLRSCRGTRAFRKQWMYWRMMAALPTPLCRIIVETRRKFQ